jgi:hypothetical protein
MIRDKVIPYATECHAASYKHTHVSLREAGFTRQRAKQIRPLVTYDFSVTVFETTTVVSGRENT